jgi:hypothetical protein
LIQERDTLLNENQTVGRLVAERQWSMFREITLTGLNGAQLSRRELTLVYKVKPNH